MTEESATSQAKIVSRYGNRVIEVPVSLVEELEHERQRHHIDIENSVGEAEGSALLADAERIKDNLYPQSSANG
jgi:hypothetical protein